MKSNSKILDWFQCSIIAAVAFAFLSTTAITGGIMERHGHHVRQLFA